jgi:hypothetical protein
MAARFLTAVAAALLLISPSLWAQSQPADPPGRVGRVSAIEGSVQQRTPDDNDWTAANLNYPVSTGFAIAPQEGGRAELQMGSMALRVGSASELDVTKLDDRDASLTLAQGELNLRVGRFDNGERIEVVTPRGVMQILAAGEYHVDAGTTESPTRFEVLNGQAELQRDGGNTALATGQAALINADDAQSPTMASVEPDALDQWAFARDGGGGTPSVNTAGRLPPAASPALPPAAAPAPAPYAAPPPSVSPEMTGAADLSAYGNWNTDPDYGAVWYPSGVPADWAPYTYGHWAWVSPWGWTWIDDEPWGFAPFHYGRWAYRDAGWCWVPGEFAAAPVFAPALVVFVGSPEHRFFFDRDREGIGWFPLGPREAYVPGYRTSINYIRNVNRTNVDVRNLNITRVNNTFVVNNARGGAVGNFANHRFATVVPANQFGRAQRVRDVAVRNASVTTAAASLPVARTPAVAAPRTVAGTTGFTDRAARFNRAGAPPVPPSRTAAGAQPRQFNAAPGANAPAREVAGHTLPALPPARGGAASNAPGRFGAGTRSATKTNAGRNLPPLPPAQGPARSFNRGGNRAPEGAVDNAPTGRAARGPFGTSRPTGSTDATSPSSAGRGLSQLPTTRQPMQRPPAPQTHIAQPPTLPTGSAGHRGFAAPAAPSPQRNAAAPTRNFAPPPRPQAPVHTAAPARNLAPPSQPQAPVHTAAPARNFAPPPRPQAPMHTAAPARSFAAPVHSAPPAAQARPAGNAAASHAPVPHPQPAQHAAPNKDKRNQS